MIWCTQNHANIVDNNKSKEITFYCNRIYILSKKSKSFDGILCEMEILQLRVILFLGNFEPPVVAGNCEARKPQLEQNKIAAYK